MSGPTDVRVGHGTPIILLLLSHWAAVKLHSVLAASITTSRFKERFRAPVRQGDQSGSLDNQLKGGTVTPNFTPTNVRPVTVYTPFSFLSDGHFLSALCH